MRSGNPVLKDNTFRDVVGTGEGVMTMNGTANKTLLFLILTLLSASWVWSNPAKWMPLVIPSAIIGFVIAMVTVFKKEWAWITGTLYALVEGIFLGAVSSIFERAYPGIVIQAVALTFGTMFLMLFAYRSGLIKPTEKFKLGVISATGAIALVYFISIIMGFFGVNMPVIYGAGPVGIIFSLVVVGVAALNLILDFDFIYQGEAYGAPKYMEWYCAFSLIVTLIWLYIELLRLLAKLRSR